MKRGRAEHLIDRVRVLLAHDAKPEDIERELASDYGIPPLVPCKGEAHSNAYIDHCPICAPRWGLLGERIKVT